MTNKHLLSPKNFNRKIGRKSVRSQRLNRNEWGKNFKEVTKEELYEVCMSFQDDSYEVNKETIGIGQELAKIKKLNVDKGEIVANFVNCLQTMYKEVAKETDNRVISKKCIKLQNMYSRMKKIMRRWMVSWAS